MQDKRAESSREKKGKELIFQESIFVLESLFA